MIAHVAAAAADTVGRVAHWQHAVHSTATATADTVCPLVHDMILAAADRVGTRRYC